MKKLIAITLFLVAGIVSAADLTVTVPAAAVPNASARCDELRLALRVIPANWNDNMCATVFTRLGLRTFVARQVRQAETETIDTAVSTALDQFDLDWPEPFIRSFCGDNNIDAEFGEQCDDGNNTPGDGCNARCLNE